MVSIGSLIGILTGIVGFVSSLYTLFKYGFKVEELWKEKEKNVLYESRIILLESKMSDVYSYMWRRAESEARVKESFFERPNTKLPT